MSDYHRRLSGRDVDMQVYRDGWALPLAALTALAWAMCLSAVVMGLGGVWVPAIGWAGVVMSLVAGVGWLACLFVVEA